MLWYVWCQNCYFVFLKLHPDVRKLWRIKQDAALQQANKNHRFNFALLQTASPCWIEGALLAVFFFMFLKLHNLIQKCPVGASCAYKAMFRKQRFPFNQNRVLSKERQRETTYPPILIKPCLQKEQFQAGDSPSSCKLTLKRTHSERVVIELVNMSSQTVVYS